MIAALLVVSLAGAFPSPATAKEAMAATAHPLATAAALEMLKDGGNAVDAAVAAAFAISVVKPMSAGLGGGGFAVIHLEPHGDKPGAEKALDFRETAPAGASRDMYLDKDGKVVDGASVNGLLSVAVPGTVAGLYALHKAYGKLPWRKVIRPAIDIARDGYIVSDHFAGELAWRKEVLSRFPATKALLWKKNGAPLAAGDRLKQRDLARTLREIARDPRSFYTGRVARAIDAEMKAGGGVLTLADLEGYQPTWRDPLCGPYEDVVLCTMPPPSSGGVHLLEMLNLLSGTDWKGLGWHNADVLQTMIEAMRIAYADRAVHLGDPAFTKVPVAALVSKAYADERKKEIRSQARAQERRREGGAAGAVGAHHGAARRQETGVQGHEPPERRRQGLKRREHHVHRELRLRVRRHRSGDGRVVERRDG